MMVGFEEAEIRGFNLFLSLIGLRIAEFRSRDTEIIPRLPELGNFGKKLQAMTK